MSKATCGHPICVLRTAGVCVHTDVAPYEGSRAGPAPSTKPRPEDVAAAEAIIGRIDPDELRAELKRRALLRDIDALAELADQERKAVGQLSTAQEMRARGSLLEHIQAWDRSVSAPS